MTQAAPAANRLLSALPAGDVDALRAHLNAVPLDAGRVLHEPHQPLGHVWFPLRGMVSLLTPMRDGTRVETAEVGPEGLVGLDLALGADRATGLAVVRVPGKAARVEAGPFRQTLDESPGLRRLLGRYALARSGQVAQNAACARLHGVEGRLATCLLLVQVVAYFYLAGQNQDWPMGDPPRLLYGTALTGLLVLSEIPNLWVKRVAKRQDLRRARLGVVVMALIGLAGIGLRAFEFGALNVGWDTNAYGSIVWALLFLHTSHIVADVAETSVIAAMLFLGPVDARRMVDVDENAQYWDFVVATWLPVYAVIYWAPRWLTP